MVNLSELRTKVIVTLLITSQAISGCTIPLETVRNFCTVGGVALAIGAIGLYRWYNKQPEVIAYKKQKKINDEIQKADKEKKLKSQEVLPENKLNNTERVGDSAEKERIRSDLKLRNLTNALLQANFDRNLLLTWHYSKLVAKRIRELQNK